MSAIANWQEEMQSAWLYRLLSTREPDPVRAKMFAQLAAAAESQAGIWLEQIRRQGTPEPHFRSSQRAKLIAALLRFFKPRTLRPVLAAMKVRGLSSYDQAMPGHEMPTRVEEIGGRHRGVGGSNLRAAVFGVNDGLVSNTSLVMGMAGATQDIHLLLTTGIAGLLAGALSMAAGEYVSMRSQRELYEYQIGLERAELEEYPEEEAEELALIYQARGMELNEARAFAHKIFKNPQHALDTLAREELGLNPDDLGSPVGAALFSFLSFSAGAVIPLLPFLVKPGAQSVLYAGLLAGGALFAVGASLSLFTGRGALWSGLRMLLIGSVSALATYALGSLLGVSLA